MSRVGNKPIAVPAGVQISTAGGDLSVKGPKGTLKRPIPPGIKVEVQAGKMQFSRQSNGRDDRSRHGLIRALAANMIKGVTEGFTRQLEINGVGYRAEVVGGKINLAVGLSHPVEIPLPEGVAAKSEKAKSTVNAGQDAVLLTVTGINNEIIGQLVSKIRSTRPPEPYKGKGVKYLEEKIKRKVGKTGAS